MHLSWACRSRRDGRAFFGGCDHGASMWDLTSNQVQQVAAHDQPIQCVHYVEDNVNQPMLITGGWDGKVRFWDLRAQQPAKEENFNCGAVVAMDTQTTPMATFLHPRAIVVYNLQTLAPNNNRPYEPNQFMRYAACAASRTMPTRGVFR